MATGIGPAAAGLAVIYPFERMGSTLFPAVRTARGRRSQEYIRQMLEQPRGSG